MRPTLPAAGMVQERFCKLTNEAFSATSTAIAMAQPDVTSAPSRASAGLQPTLTLTATGSLTLESTATAHGSSGDPLTVGAQAKNGEVCRRTDRCQGIMTEMGK